MASDRELLTELYTKFGSRVYARGQRAVRGGARGVVRLRRSGRLRVGRYRLLLTFADAHGRQTVVTQRVRVR